MFARQPWMKPEQREPRHLYGKVRKAWCNHCQGVTEQAFQVHNWKWTCKQCGTEGLL